MIIFWAAPNFFFKVPLPSLLLFFLGAMAVILVPALLYRRFGSAPGPTESDGGGGPGPDQPCSSSDPPRGGLPLPDADQATTRARDHRLKLHDRKRRPDAPKRRTPVR